MNTSCLTALSLIFLRWKEASENRVRYWRGAMGRDWSSSLGKGVSIACFFPWTCRCPSMVHGKREFGSPRIAQNRGDFWIQGFLQNKGDWLIRKRMKKSYLVKDIVSERKTPR